MPSLPTCSVLPVRVQLQTQTTYRGIVDCMAKTYRHESVGGRLFGGLWGGRPLGSRCQLPSPLPAHRTLPMQERKKTQIWGPWGAEQ